MNQILDTHTLIWFLNGDDRLSLKARLSIENNQGNNFVSIASIWEISIKLSLGKFNFNKGFKSFLELIENNGFDIIPFTFQHALIISSLEFKHRDPFDRLIIAQAIAENCTVVTKDKEIEKYDIITFW